MNSNDDDPVDEIFQTIMNHIHNNPILQNHNNRISSINRTNRWVNDNTSLSGSEISGNNLPLSISIPRINIPSPRFLSNSMFDPRSLTFGESILDDEDSSTDADIDVPILHNSGTQTNEDNCCVCYKETSYLNVVNTPCKHNVCSNCFFRWIKISPSCPICRLDFTSWDRLTFDDINTELNNVNEMFRTVVSEHNHLLLRKKNLENKVKDSRVELKDITKSCSRRRNMTDFIRGYNHAIMIGNNDPIMRWDDNKASYVNGYRNGLKERRYFLNAMGIREKDFLNYHPTKNLYKKIIRNKPVRIIRRKRNFKKHDLQNDYDSDSSVPEEKTIEEIIDDVALDDVVDNVVDDIIEEVISQEINNST